MAIDITKPNWGNKHLTIVFNVGAVLSLAILIAQLVGFWRARRTS